MTLPISLSLALVYRFVDRIIALGSLASILAGLETGVGALPALFYREVSRKTLNTLLGGVAGVMLAAKSSSLIVPGIQVGNELWPSRGIYVVAVAMPLVALGYRREQAVIIAILTGLIEPVAEPWVSSWLRSFYRSCRLGWLLSRVRCSSSSTMASFPKPNHVARRIMPPSR